MSEYRQQPEDDAERILRPEEEDPLEALATFEDALRGAVRGVRAKVFPYIDADQPTMLEGAASKRPVTAAAVAMASGLMLGFVVRRAIPRRFR